jgi:hypothetical protein
MEEKEEEQPKKRDFWEKMSLVLQSSGGLLTAVTVALIGLLGSNYLKDRELRETQERERTQIAETNTRVWVELMSKREEAESALRKDMFVSIIQSFLRPGTASLDERVLNLELLSYNFHESLNLKPLFLYLERQIAPSGDPHKKEYLDRLYRVATEISRKQMLVLEGAGKKFDRDIDLSVLKNNPGGLRLDNETLTLNDVTRRFSLVVLGADPQTRQINVRLEIQTPVAASGSKAGETGKPQVENGNSIETSTADFWVGYFDFPMIDNTRMTHDQRAAVILNAFEDGYASVTLTYFPGSYASLKEKASYQEVFQNLVKTNKTLAGVGPD